MVRFVSLLWLLLASRYGCSAHSTTATESITAILDVEGALVQPQPHSLHRHHHNCIHDEKLDEFAATVDARSLVVHQRLAPHIDSYAQSLIVDDFLNNIGATKAASTPQRKLIVQSSVQASFLPLRIAFDLSKLTSDPGYMCTTPGETVTVDGSQSYTCSADDLLTSSKKEFIVSVLLKAISNRFGSTLSVQRVTGNLIITGISCGSSDVWACCAQSVPSAYKTEGVANADYLLHVTARPTTGSTIAWALPCNIDQYGRPISGHANFGPARLDPTSSTGRDEQIGTALHEMTHALVFSKGRFTDFRQPFNGAKWGYSNVVSQTTTSSNVVVSKIITPSVVKQVKKQFNCYDWSDAGLELENGDKGSAAFSSHWEKRVVMNEYMSATSSYDPVYSALTLALFEDSGWYQVNFSSAETLAWGYLEGCGVARSRCSTWSSRYICSDAEEDACTADNNAKGYCNIAQYSASIPAGFQYFQDPTLGGRDTYADYCPFYRAYSNGDCRNIGRSPTNIDADNWLEVADSSSKCFMSSLSRKGSSSASLRPTCYQVLGCTASSLMLSIGGQTVSCPLAGGEVTVGGLRGKLQCPTTGARLCQMMQNKCSGAGVLLSTGKCQCLPGYTGDNCSSKTCPEMTKSDGSLDECGAKSGRGSCDRSTGTCACKSAYTGLSCSELVCPVLTASKNRSECSGHGSCDRDSGTCTCADGYSGTACQCVPGCSTDDTSSCGGAHGTCDCLTGACACASGYSGIACGTSGSPSATELQLPIAADDTESTSATVADKEYTFFKVYLNSSTYDVTFALTGDTDDVDVDIYGSFEDAYPTSLTSSAIRFASTRDAGETDAIQLCGTLGVFPRSTSDPLRYCARATTAFVQSTPGYFYVSVLGFVGGSYSLTVETDKCKGVTCSDHGTCGLLFAGVCSCDRYWSGDDCSVPKCGPDCEDLGTCAAGGWASTTDASLSGIAIGSLRNTSECYGNGVCQVNSTSQNDPTCTCDAAYYFANPTTRDQELCKELVPSVAYLRHYTEPFVVSSDLLDLYVDIGAWALFTLEVKDEWEVLVATLETKTLEADAMLFVRKEKLPTTAVDGTSATSASSSSVQYTDTASWTAGKSTRKVVLSRASSTLSSGLYYIGVYNSPYGRASLGYDLVVNATESCSGSTSSSSSSTASEEDPFGICENGGVCNALASDICACPNTFAGKFCALNVSRLSLASPSSSSWASYAALNTSNSTLGIGGWDYFSFDIEETTARMAQIELVIANRLDIPTPARPILLVRSPSDSDFPTLYSDALQDFEGVQNRSKTQVVPLAIESAACSFSTNHKHCYKLAVHNRATAGAALIYSLRVTLFSSLSAAYPSATTCLASGSSSSATEGSTCLGRGTCALIQDPDDSGSVLPSCTCSTGWSGLRCGSPTSFDASQLWTALGSISLLCSSCTSTSFSLSRGQIRVFRVPEPLRAGVGLKLSIESSDASAAVPNVYVSEFMPRSVSDFSYISNGAGDALQLTSGSLSGHFWVVVYSELSSSSTTLSAGVGRRLGAAAASFRLVAAPFALPASSTASTLLSDRSFTAETFAWLVHSPLGLATLAVGVSALALALCFCLWRVARAPEHRDALAAQHFGLKPRATALAPLSAVVDAGVDAGVDATADAVDGAAVEMGLMAAAPRRIST